MLTDSDCLREFNVYVFEQERLVLSILPRFVALEMIADMTSMDDELLPQQFHKVYIHQYTDVRYGTTPSSLAVMIY